MKTGDYGRYTTRDSETKVRVVEFLDYVKAFCKKEKLEAVEIMTLHNSWPRAMLRAVYPIDHIEKIFVENADLHILRKKNHDEVPDARLIGDYVAIANESNHSGLTHSVWRYVCVDGIFYLVQQILE